MKTFLALSLLSTLIATSARADDAAGREALLKADRDFATAAQTRGVEAWVENWAENGVHPDGPAGVVVGKDGIRKQMGPRYATPGFKLEWSPSHAEISRGGNVGTTKGRYKSTSMKDGKQVVRTGDYFTVWQKEKDGSWKISFDTGDVDPEPPPKP
ncbi:MAG: YybH family protein [Acidobacteriota bacterium]